jgi:lysophospholipid acyltransferase (LPLAT)-like uncharacterized protein
MKRILQSAFVQAGVAWLAARYVLLVAGTVRWRVEGGEWLAAFAEGGPFIVVFWHESLPSMPVMWRRAVRAGMRREAVVLASRHRDGQLIGRVVRNLGIGLVSGSSSRGGAAGLRPPRRVAAAGVARLAGLSGVAVLPCAAHVGWAVGLRSWDGMRLPLPFGRGVLVCGAPVRVPRDDWAAMLPVIEAALNAAIERAEAG